MAHHCHEASEAEKNREFRLKLDRESTERHTAMMKEHRAEFGDTIAMVNDCKKFASFLDNYKSAIYNVVLWTFGHLSQYTTVMWLAPILTLLSPIFLNRG